jgi:hypothetical protein
MLLPFPSDLYRVSSARYGKTYDLELVSMGMYEPSQPEWPYLQVGTPSMLVQLNPQAFVLHSPVANSDTENVVLRGYAQPSASVGGIALLTTDTSEPAIVARYHRALALWAAWYLGSKELRADEQAVALAMECLAEYRMLVEDYNADAHQFSGAIWYGSTDGQVYEGDDA